jgi:hypothetical protein
MFMVSPLLADSNLDNKSVIKNKEAAHFASAPAQTPTSGQACSPLSDMDS